MPGHSLGFTSIDPIRRRMSQSPTQVSPGFPAVISAIDENTRTVDLWVQGSDFELKGVNYATSFEEKPSYIKIGGVVYVRHQHGNKFGLEIEGPGHVIPTVKAGSTPTPPNTGFPDQILSGLEVVAPAYPSRNIAVTTGRARFSGVDYDFTYPKVGETLDAKVTGATPGKMKFGVGRKLANTYVYFPVPTNASLTNYRYDQVEMGPDRILDYVQGVASTSPVTTTPQADHFVLGTVLCRPNFTTITPNEINAPFVTGYIMDVLPSFSQVTIGTLIIFTVFIYDQNLAPVQNQSINGYFTDPNGIRATNPAVYGTMTPNPGAATGSSGAVFFYYDTTGATKSPYVSFQSPSVSYQRYATVTILDANGNPLPR